MGNGTKSQQIAKLCEIYFFEITLTAGVLGRREKYFTSVTCFYFPFTLLLLCAR